MSLALAGLATAGLGGAGASPLAYAFTLGLVAALNPCGFPLLPAYLSVFVDNGGCRGWAGQTARGLLAGTSVTAGFVAVFAAAALVVESGARILMHWVPWAMIPVGMGLVALGALTFVGRSTRLPLPSIRLHGRRGFTSMVLFGVAYAVASLSCALPLFLAGVAGSFTRLGPAGGLATGGAYALGSGLFLTVVSLVAAHAGAAALRRIRPISRFVPRLAGLVVTVVGAYLVYYWANYLVDPSATPTVVRFAEQVSSLLTGWLGDSSRLAGLVLGLVVVGALGLLALRSRPPAGSPGGSRGEMPSHGH